MFTVALAPLRGYPSQALRQPVLLRAAGRCLVRRFAHSLAADLVRLDLYPIDRLDEESTASFASQCAASLSSEGVLVLQDFLTPAAVKSFLVEEQALHQEGATSHVAYDHTTEFNTDLEDEAVLSSLEPHRILRAQQRVLGYHQFASGSLIRELFHWPPVLRFVRAVMEQDLHLSADTMNCLHSQRYIHGDELGWHHDKSEFFFNIMMQPATGGGQFEYVKGSKDKEALVESVLCGGRDGVRQVDIRAGTVVIFKGRENLHCVTPVTEDSQDRISVIFNFATCEGGGVLDDETRRLFFGNGSGGHQGPRCLTKPGRKGPRCLTQPDKGQRSLFLAPATCWIHKLY